MHKRISNIMAGGCQEIAIEMQDVPDVLMSTSENQRSRKQGEARPWGIPKSILELGGYSELGSREWAFRFPYGSFGHYRQRDDLHQVGLGIRSSACLQLPVVGEIYASFLKGDLDGTPAHTQGSRRLMFQVLIPVRISIGNLITEPLSI